MQAAGPPSNPLCLPPSRLTRTSSVSLPGWSFPLTFLGRKREGQGSFCVFCFLITGLKSISQKAQSGRGAQPQSPSHPRPRRALVTRSRACFYFIFLFFSFKRKQKRNSSRLRALAVSSFVFVGLFIAEVGERHLPSVPSRGGEGSALRWFCCC